MPEPKSETRDGQLIHFSVGSIIREGERVLLIDRAKPPFGWAGPAGHIDEDETPEQAIAREIQEETGLEVISQKLQIEEFVPWNECSKGVRGHHWYVFGCEVRGKLKAHDDEFKTIGFYALKDFKNFEPVWEYWFKELGML